MAFSEPKTVTMPIAGALVFARVSTEPNKSVYMTGDGAAKMTVSHQYGKRKRSLIRFDFSKTAVDPLVPAINVPYNNAWSLSVDRPFVGYTVAQLQDELQGIVGLLSATSYSDTVKFLGGEN